MRGPISNVEHGKRTDTYLHKEIISAINFTKSKAYNDALVRLMNLGFSEEDATTLLKEKK